jgi:hypothetical protein
MCVTPPSLGVLETEVDQELRSLNRSRNVEGSLSPSKCCRYVIAI